MQDLPSSSGLLYRARCARPTQFIWSVVQSKVQKTYPAHLACCTEQGVQDLPSSSGLLYRAKCKRPTQLIWPVVQSKVCKTYPVHLAGCTEQGAKDLLVHLVCCTEQGVQDLPSSSGWLYRARCARPTQFIWPVVQSKVCKTYPVHLACCTRAAPRCPLLPPQQKPCLPDQPRLEHLHDVPVSPQQHKSEERDRPIVRGERTLFRPIAVFLRILEISQSKQLSNCLFPNQRFEISQSKQLPVPQSRV